MITYRAFFGAMLVVATCNLAASGLAFGLDWGMLPALLLLGILSRLWWGLQRLHAGRSVPPLSVVMLTGFLFALVETIEAWRRVGHPTEWVLTYSLFSLGFLVACLACYRVERS